MRPLLLALSLAPGVPRRLSSDKSAHSGGIFSMDVRALDVLTARVAQPMILARERLCRAFTLH